MAKMELDEIEPAFAELEEEIKILTDTQRSGRR
jgi:hypothetical protein